MSSAAAGHVLEVRGLSVRMPTRAGMLHAVNGVDFSVARGRTLCLVGESGCGKSLTAFAVMGLLPKRAVRSAATLRFDAEDLLRASPSRMSALRGDRISMIFQDPMTALNPLFTIGTQIRDVLRQHRRVGRREAAELAIELLARVGVPDPAGRLDQYPHQQSGGLRQRIMIAMALICKPLLLIADEPTTALDATVQAQLLELLAELQSQSGTGMLFITHDLGVVANIADEVAVMYGGAIVEIGPAAEVLRRPQHPYTQALIACLPRRGVTPRRSPLRTIPGSPPSLIGAASGCAFRARCEHARPACGSEAGQALHSLSAAHQFRCLAPVGGASALAPGLAGRR